MVTLKPIWTAIAVVVSLFLFAPPASAADTAALTAQIDQISPSNLASGKQIRLGGVVRNTGSTTWTSVQAYLVMPRTGFTSRSELEDAIKEGRSYTGERVVEVGRFAELDSLTPGQSKRFEIKVPAKALGLTGAEGIYPVGVQILATDHHGVRSNDAVARATTFIPLISEPKSPTPAGLVWPFTLTSELSRDQLGALANSVATGRLRRYLDAAIATVPAGRTIVFDPALLDLLSELTDEENPPAGIDLTNEQVKGVSVWLKDFRELANSSTTWVVGYDRPDELAFSRHREHSNVLLDRVKAATTNTLTEQAISGSLASWPTITGVTNQVLDDIRSRANTPVVVSRSTVPDWVGDAGSVATVKTPSGVTNLVINGALADPPGEETPATLRQRILTDAALAQFSKRENSQSRADALTFVDPSWDPGLNAGPNLALALTANESGGLSEPVTAAKLLSDSPPPYTGKVPSSVATKSLTAAYLSDVATWSELAGNLDSIVVGSDSSTTDSAIATAVSVRWRADLKKASALVSGQINQLQATFAKIKIESPSAITLSSSRGGFPLTVVNGTSHEIKVGLQVTAENDSIKIADTPPVRIAAGDRHTVTVEADLGEQNSSTVSARLVSVDGQLVGEEAVFNVRSSKVSLIVWLAMGIAMIGVVATLGRRFFGGRRVRE